MKSQDMLVLSVLMKKGAGKLSYSGIGRNAKISVSEAFAAVKRLREADLVNSAHDIRRRNVEEFLFHGLRYMFPLKVTGEMASGMPTGFAAPVSSDAFAVCGHVPVWNSRRGDTVGRVCEPIYPTAPDAAAEDSAVYAHLALMDMLRGGRLRERRFAEEKLKEMLA